MNKRRLLKLADLLDADARRKRGIKFNMQVVAMIDRMPADGHVKLDCGTQACAMGLAALSGAFKRGGLSYRISEDAWNGLGIDTLIDGRRCDYDRAAMKIFDITGSEAEFLFDPGCYHRFEQQHGAKGERYVAKRIRDFVAGKVSPDGV